MPVARRPLGRSLLELVTPKFLSLSGAPHPPQLPATARATAGTEVGEGPPPGLPAPQPGPVHVTCPALPAPGRRVPRARSGRAARLQLLLLSGRAAGSADRRAEPRGQGRDRPPPRGRGAEGGGPKSGPRRPGRRALRPIVAARAHPAPSAPRPSASAAPSARPGSVTRAARAINNLPPAPGAPPVTPAWREERPRKQ